MNFLVENRAVPSVGDGGIRQERIIITGSHTQKSAVWIARRTKAFVLLIREMLQEKKKKSPSQSPDSGENDGNSSGGESCGINRGSIRSEADLAT